MVDNLITLFDVNETQFSTNGLGSLCNATSCVVVENRNGEYELEMTYPINSEASGSDDFILMDDHRDIITDFNSSNVSIATRPLTYEEIKFNRIIFTKPNPYADPQPFRIYAISKPIDGIITINAQHISYDLSGVSVSPFTAGGVADAFVKLKTKAVGNCPFTFWTDKTSTSTMTNSVPSSMRSLLGGSEGSILDLYGGEYEFDKFTVKLHNHRGTNRGVSIRYGKNLTDIKQDENCSEVYTAIYPYYYAETDAGNVLVELDEKTINVEGEFDHTRIMTVDLTEYFESVPTKDELRYVAQLYLNAYNIGTPDISLTVSFVPLSDSEEYKDYSLLERVMLCDTVNVEFPKMKISATAKCISTKYDVLSNKYISIELGNARSDLASTIASFNEAVNELPTKTFLEQAIENATNLITGQNGGYVVLNPPNQPRELLVMDSPDIETATRVWRWNAAGLGYSRNGYNGPYALAMTMDGSIVADFINTGTLSANLIRAGLLTDFNNTNYWNLSTGEALFTNLKVRKKLNLIDTDNFRRVSIGYDNSNGAGLWMYDGDHTASRVYLGIPGSRGNYGAPLLALGDENGTVMTYLTHRNGAGRLTTYDDSARQMVDIFATEYGGVVNVAHKAGVTVGSLGADAYGGKVAINDYNGEVCGAMFIDEYGYGNLAVDGDLYGRYMGKSWVQTYVQFNSLAVDHSWGNMYCSAEQNINYTALGLTNVDNVFITVATLDGGMWAWAVNTKIDDTYVYFVLARPTNATCENVKVSLLLIGD